MKVAILAGGTGTRLAEETELRPKPMVEIGGKPILWHIMKTYGAAGFEHFVIALGYKGDQIKKFFVEYCELSNDLTVTTHDRTVTVHGMASDRWTVELVDTGQLTQTGGRIRRLAPHLSDGTFMLTWGDGVAAIDLPELLEFHRSTGRIATLTAARPPARFGHIEIDETDPSLVAEFSEKPQTGEGWINGAYFVLEPEVFDYIDGDDTHFEREPLEQLAKDRQLAAYRHYGFWQCMDTLRDKRYLETLWDAGDAPWKVWS